MTTPTTPEQARELSDDAKNLGLWADHRSLYNVVRDADRYSDALHSLAQQVESLTADRDALKADAERYRHLRDAENEGDYSIGEATDFCDGGWERVTWRYGDELDAAIDAAMKSAS